MKTNSLNTIQTYNVAPINFQYKFQSTIETKKGLKIVYQPALLENKLPGSYT